VAGTYTVKLTVTDNDGGTGTSSKSVTVVAPAGPNLAVDTFSRAVTNGLGTADTGGNWTLSGTGTNFAVANGVGTIKMSAAASGPSAYLSTVSGADVDATVNMAFDKDATGGGTYASLAVRRNGTSDYRAKVRYVLGGSVQVSLVRLVSGAETSLGTITVPGLSYAVGDTLQVRLNVAGSGTTTLSSKVWKVGTTEPADWQITRTDTTAGLQSAGGVGLAAYLSGSSTQAPALAIFDNLSVRSQ
jgi:PKD repeat protein